MANEVIFKGPGVGRTCYFTIHNATSGYIWSTSGGTGGYVTFVSGDWADYAVSVTEEGVSNVYKGSVPAAVPAGVLSIDARQQLGGGALQTDTSVAVGEVQWNGSAVRPLSDLTTSGQLSTFMPVKLAKGNSVSGFPIYLKSSADHITPFTSGILSGQISRNAGAFGALQSGVFVEIGLGAYAVNLTSGDTNADSLVFNFSAVGVSGGTADPLVIGVLTQKPGS